MDPRLPFQAPRDHSEEIANALAQRDFDRAVLDAHIRKLKKSRDNLAVILVIAICIAGFIGGVTWAISKYLAINIPL